MEGIMWFLVVIIVVVVVAAFVLAALEIRTRDL